MKPDEKNGDTPASKKHIRVTKNGPYIVTGDIPIIKTVIETDQEGYPHHWQEVERYPQHKTYALCRCGKSENKPYCDGKHTKIKFDGTEIAGHEKFLDCARIFDGPELRLYDNKKLCVGSGFCTRDGNIWNLTTHSDNPEFKQIAIEEAEDCPSGRLVLQDKEGNSLEPQFTPSIAVTKDENGVPGPIWVRGEISITSAQGKDYEKRNRVTLCNCGKSCNKPLCDGSHLE